MYSTIKLPPMPCESHKTVREASPELSAGRVFFFFFQLHILESGSEQLYGERCRHRK